MSVPECTCKGNDASFVCPVYKLRMTAKMHHDCQTNEGARKAFHIYRLQKEMQEKEPEGPGLLDMAKNFGKAAVAHVKTGMAHVSEEEKQRRLDICNLCDKKKGNRCSECGCLLQIKTSWQSSECPLKKW